MTFWRNGLSLKKIKRSGEGVYGEKRKNGKKIAGERGATKSISNKFGKWYVSRCAID